MEIAISITIMRCRYFRLFKFINITQQKMQKSLGIICFLFSIIFIVSAINNNHEYLPSDSLKIQIDEKMIEPTSKYEFSIHSSGAKQNYIQSIATNNEQIVINGDFGILRMYRKDKPLVIYEANELRITCPQHYLKPSNLDQKTLQVQVVYSLSFGNEPSYSNIGLSYFLVLDQSKEANQKIDFAQKIIKYINNYSENNSSQISQSQQFKFQQYFPLPTHRQAENLYIYRPKQANSSLSKVGWLWAIRRQKLFLPKQSFENLVSLLTNNEVSQEYCPDNKYQNGSTKVWAARIRSFKDSSNTNMHGKLETSERQCESDKSANKISRSEEL